jgi:membrane-associated phospholipid phosphatase
MTTSGLVGWLLATIGPLGLAALPALGLEGAAPAPLPDAPSALMAARFRGFDPAEEAPAAPEPSHPSVSDQPHHGIFLRGLQRGLQDQGDIYSAPFHRSALRWDLGFVAGSAGLIAADKHASGALSRDDLELSRRISDVGYYAAIASPGVLWLTSAASKDPHARETGTLGLEALANTAALYGVMQVAAGRERPLEGDRKGHFWQNNSLGSSFPSGHAAFTWTAASVIAHEYPTPWVEWLTYGTATAVSVTRFTGLKHFPADAVVGSAFGYLIGRHIYHAHCQAGLSPICERKPRLLRRANNQGRAPSSTN